MRKLIVVLVALAHVGAASPSFADGPLAAAAARAAARYEQSRERPPVRAARLWSGFAMVGGGAALVVVSSTLEATTDCRVLLGRDGFSQCQPGINQALLWSGVAAIGGGAVLMWTGTRTSLAAGPQQVTWRVRF